ncbi:hypothetical protein MNBD_NITROSPINAE02-1537 [hydrothermal vent metagenome]|uniref:SprT-like domain-containing protein n=1 Tax=hydrothermal vent metagenome TaxID=652676 RepID=A0A3B1BQU1_9ZZZZ
MINSPNLFEKALIDNIIQKIGSSASVTLTDNRKSLISIRKSRGGTKVRLSRSFAMADETVWTDLARYIKGEITSAPKSVMDFAHGRTTPDHLIKKALSGLDPEGKVYNLAKISLNINNRYFRKPLKVNIKWGNLSKPKRRSRNKTIQLGSYDRDVGLIRIHPVLDNDFVPPEYIGLVVYHEMLHQKIELAVKNGGGRSGHTPEFSKLEKEYEQYDLCMAWEKKNMNHLLELRKRL